MILAILNNYWQGEAMHKIFSSLKGFAIFWFHIDGEGWDDSFNSGDKNNHAICGPFGNGESNCKGDGRLLDFCFSDGTEYGDGQGNSSGDNTAEEIFYLDKEELIDA
jgi:hypothetical protein